MKKAKTPLKTEGDKDRGRCQAHVEVVILVAEAAKDRDVRSKVTERQVRRRQCDRRGNPKGYEHHACGSDAFAFHRADERLLGPIVWRNDQPQVVLVKELGPKPGGGRRKTELVRAARPDELLLDIGAEVERGA